MISLLAAFLAAGQPAPPPGTVALGHTAWIFSTVGHSEWCPPGNVRLDLRTGHYAFTDRAPRQTCNEARLERSVSMGTLGAERLAAVRVAYLRVLAEGFTNPVCREGGRPDTIIVSNGGTPILVLATGADTVSAPDALTCWSEAASALHDLLDDSFGSAP